MKRFKKVSSLIIAASLMAGLITGCFGNGSNSKNTNKKIEVVFIGESSATDVIWSYRAERMREEANRLGVGFTDRYADGDFARQVQMIEEEVARGVSAIIAPFFDPEVSNAALKKAIDKGVVVYALLGVPNLPAEYLSKICQATTDWADFGGKLAEVALDSVPNGGTILWPAEAPEGTYITDAVARFEKVAAQKGKTVKINVVGVGSDPSAAASTILSYLTANPNTAAVCTSGAIAIGAANTAMIQGKLTPGKPPLFGQVVSPVSSKGIMGGYMPKGVNLELTESSYFAVQSVVSIVKDGAKPGITAVPLVVVTKDNIKQTVPDQLR